MCFFFVTLLCITRTLWKYFPMVNPTPRWKIRQIDPPSTLENPIPFMVVVWIFSGTTHYRILRFALLLGFCTLCFCFPTKMLHLNAPFFPLKCSVSPKKSLKCSDNAHYTNGFFKLISKFTLTKTCKCCK